MRNNDSGSAMYVVVLILALLLFMFGGGCTLILLAGAVGDPRSMFADLALLMSIWLPLGLAPLAGGIALWRVALNMKKKWTQEALSTDEKEGP
jgi:hypothetical protein